MTITMEPTPVTGELGGVPVRVWNGVTADGVRCRVFVALVAVPDTHEAFPFEVELAPVEVYPTPDAVPRTPEDD